MSSFKRVLSVFAATVALFAGAGVPPANADAIDMMDDPLYQRLNPTSGTSLVTPWADESAAAGGSWGYTTDLGQPFKASTTPGTGLTAVHRLWNANSVDFIEALTGSTAFNNAKAAGYVDQGVRFYAAPAATSGRTQPVNSYAKGGKHRLATAAMGATLASQGWTLEGVAFHVPAPATTPAPPSTPAPGPAPDPAPVQDIGALPVGTASYPVPSGAVFVAPSGNDNNAGTLSAPVRTISRAVAIVPTGGTVVVRGGVYRESVTMYKTATVQNYPGEAVWLDGSVPVTGWVGDGTSWRKDGWTTRFDHSPTYTQGAADGAAPYWQFVNPSSYPMAAHPDQVFVNGVAQQQVKDRSQVKPGTFYLDEGSSRLYLGSNPGGQTVEASTIIKALSIRAAKSVVRGIGIRRYSPSVFHIAAVTVEQPGVRLENVVVADSATTGLSVQREDIALEKVTVTGAGMLGIHARNADRIVLSKVLATKNNDERFNIAPVAGGIKLGVTRGITVTNSSFSGNYGHGFWEDMSNYNSTFRQSRFDDNVGTGLFLEISAKAVVGDNSFRGNDEFGIKVNNTSDVKIWNNTFVGNGRPLNIVQDSRRNTNINDPAVDRRIAWPDPAMPWTLGPVTIRNNVVADATSAANCLLCVEDYSQSRTAEQMQISANGNVYQRPTAARPTWIVVWSRGAGNPYVFTTLSAFRSTTGQEARGREYVGSSIVDSNGTLVASVSGAAADIAEPLPSDIASAIGRPAGTKRLGKW